MYKHRHEETDLTVSLSLVSEEGACRGACKHPYIIPYLSLKTVIISHICSSSTKLLKRYIYWKWNMHKEWLSK